MQEEYVIIRRDILPESWQKVLEVKRLLETREAKDVSEAARAAGLSRSTYYKYRDSLMEFSSAGEWRTMVLGLMLRHEAGTLSTLLARISETGASVLTISQSLPVRDRANVQISLDISRMSEGLSQFMDKISASPGAENIKILAVE